LCLGAPSASPAGAPAPGNRPAASPAAAQPTTPPATPPAAPPAAPAGPPAAEINVASPEVMAILKDLEAAGNNQTRAAEMLSISRDQLRYRLQKWGWTSRGGEGSG